MGTQIHTSPQAFGKVMSTVKPRHAIGYHFFNDENTRYDVFEGVRQTCDGPLSLATDNMVWNITRNNIIVRMTVSPDHAWSVAGPTAPPKPPAKGEHNGKPLVTPSVVILVLLGGALVAYPYTQVSVARPVVMAGELDEQQAQQLLQALLKNVYRAFDFRDENDVYDKLALSVEGDLITEIYLQNRKSFAVQKAGGAQAKVKDVDIKHAQAERQAGDTPTYAIRGQWTATGTVGHWGHVHTRRNQYDAIVTVKADQGDWKISGLELLEEQRIDPAASAAAAAR